MQGAQSSPGGCRRKRKVWKEDRRADRSRGCSSLETRRELGQPPPLGDTGASGRKPGAKPGRTRKPLGHRSGWAAAWAPAFLQTKGWGRGLRVGSCCRAAGEGAGGLGAPASPPPSWLLFGACACDVTSALLTRSCSKVRVIPALGSARSVLPEMSGCLPLSAFRERVAPQTVLALPGQPDLVARR